MEELKTPRLLRIDQVLQLYPISRSRWYAGVKMGEFPEPIKLGERSVAWLQSDIVDLIDKRRMKDY